VDLILEILLSSLARILPVAVVLDTLLGVDNNAITMVVVVGYCWVSLLEVVVW
jgi:hypothetical protein